MNGNFRKYNFGLGTVVEFMKLSKICFFVEYFTAEFS